MPILKSSNAGSPYAGLFARATDRLCVADVSVSHKFLSALHALGVPVMKTAFGGFSMAGICLAMNSRGAVVPSFCSREETDALKSWDLEVLRLPGAFSAAGNNIAANDYGCIANPDIPAKLAGKISDCLGVEVAQMKVAGYKSAGSCVLATNSGFLAHSRADSSELKELASILRVTGLNSTLCTGVPFVSLCAVANSRGAVLGESCSGFEAGRAAEGLSLI